MRDFPDKERINNLVLRTILGPDLLLGIHINKRCRYEQKNPPCCFRALIRGCFFGGESDSPTGIVKDNGKTADSLSKAEMPITPGVYAGDYTWIDSNRAGMESEFILDASGSYRLFWIFDNEAIYDQRGNWYQGDSALYFTDAKESVEDYGTFDSLAAIENDTNAILA